jgi:hypothetical protein
MACSDIKGIFVPICFLVVQCLVYQQGDMIDSSNFQDVSFLYPEGVLLYHAIPVRGRGGPIGL